MGVLSKLLTAPSMSRGAVTVRKTLANHNVPKLQLNRAIWSSGGPRGFHGGRAFKRPFHGETPREPPVEPWQQAWQQSHVPTVVLGLMACYFLFDNRRLKQTIDKFHEDSHHSLVPSTLVVSEQPPDWEAEEESKSESVVDSIENGCEPDQETQIQHDPENQGAQMQQDSGKSEVDPSTASEVIPPLTTPDDYPAENALSPDEDKLATPPAVVLEEEETKEVAAPETHEVEEQVLDASGQPVAVKHDNNVVRFKDIQGYNKVKKDLQGVVDLLKDPKGTEVMAKKLGGKVPKGVVFFGPRCCGKKTVARAVAG